LFLLFCGKRQRNERWPRLLNLHPKLPRYFVSKGRRADFWNRKSARCDDQGRRAKLFRVGPNNELCRPGNLLHTLIQKCLNPHSAAFFFQHLRDVARGAVAKKLPQRFCVIRNPMFLHEAYKVSRRVTSQGRFREMWIRGNEIVRRAMDIREIAAPAARNQNLLPNLLRPLDDGHAPPAFFGLHGAHQPRRSRAQHYHVKCFAHFTVSPSMFVNDVIVSR